jgi:hypothetical protein
MQLPEVEHVLRAAADITKEKSFVLVGSQAILLMVENVPQELLVSTELDLYPAMHPEKSDMIDGAIGALSTFHDTHGFHADGVSPETAVMPPDWQDRQTLHYLGELTAICPELHDLAVSKCVAGRDKDAQYIRALFTHDMIDLKTLIERIATLDAARYPIAHVIAWAERRAREAQKGATP